VVFWRIRSGERSWRLSWRAAADALCTAETFPRGETIYSPEHFRRSLGIFLSGAARVSKAAAGRDLPVSTLSAGDVFGAAALFDEGERYVTSITAIRPCRVLFYPQALVERLLEESPPMRRAYVTYLSGRIRFLNRKLDALLAGGAEERLAKYLAESAGNGEVTLGANLSALADTLHIGRASLYRAFEALEERDLAVRDGHCVKILDQKGLQALGKCR
jgi:CRP-like cAMP-binding protein